MLEPLLGVLRRRAVEPGGSKGTGLVEAVTEEIPRTGVLEAEEAVAEGGPNVVCHDASTCHRRKRREARRARSTGRAPQRDMERWRTTRSRGRDRTSRT